MKKLGLVKEDNPENMSAEDKNKHYLTNNLANDPNVKYQMNNGNRQKVELLHKEINSLWVSTDNILNILKTITGPNQRAAIFIMYGERGIISRMWFKGDLYDNVKYVCLPWQWTKLKPQMDLFLKVK